MSNTDVLFNEMSDAIEWLDDEKAMELVETSLKTGMDPVDVIEKGFSKGLKIVGDRFGKGEAFLTELVAAANIMEEVSNKLSGALTGSSMKVESKGKVLLEYPENSP